MLFDFGQPANGIIQTAFVATCSSGPSKWCEPRGRSGIVRHGQARRAAVPNNDLARISMQRLCPSVGAAPRTDAGFGRRVPVSGLTLAIPR